MEINFEKKKVLIEWINCVIDEASISSLQELKNSAKLLTKLLNNIDPDVVVPNVGNSECVSFIVCHIKGFFSIDIVDEKEILLGNELEIGKLLCLMLELTLTSENNMETIEKVQNLPKSVQTGIMAVTNLVGENSQSSNLSQILNNWLIQNAFEDISTSSGMSPIVSTAVIPIASSTIFESPKLHSTIGDLSGNSSPLQVFSASPQALYRRVMVENKKLKQKVRHSELFLKQQSQFIEQLDVDAETEKKELFNQHMKLVKEHDALLQKFYDSESSLSKIKEEIEFLQLEVHSKEKEVIEQTAIAKELKEVVKSLQESLEHYSDIDAKLQLQQSVNAEQVSKNTNLSLKINQLEEEKCTLKSELLKAKEAVNKLTSDLFKKQADYVDQTKHLENEVKRLENELSNSQACQESLGETLKRESEITKLRNSLNIQEHTIVNMGIDSQRKDAKLNDLMTELETIRQKYDEESESFKKQSSQFMDQISSLLKQTEEQKFNHEQLTVKIQSAEERSKLLERQIESYEQNEKKINEQIQLQGSDLKAKTFGVTALQHELDDTKAKLMQQNMLNAQLEAKLEVLKFEKQNRIETEKQYQSLLVENLHLKHTQEKYELLKTEMEKLKSLEEECRVLREKTVRLELELKSSVERCSELKENVQLSKQYEQKCIVLDEKLMSLNEDIRLKEMNFEKELKSSRLLYDELLSVKNNSEVEIKSYQEQNSILKVKNKELEEFKSQFVAIQSANEKLQAENLSLQVFVNACLKLEEENLKLKAELLQMTSQFSASSSELARITQENQQNKLNELQKSLNGCKNNVSEVADLKMRVNDLLKEKSDLLSLLECEKQLNVSMKRSEMLMEKKCDAILHEKDLLEKEIKRQCELFDIERNEVNEHVDNAILEYQDNVLTFENEKANFLKLRSDNKKLCREVDAKKKSILNLEEKCKELASEVELKQESINRLENRCVEQDIACRNLTSNNRSLETQLASAENIIQNLKKEIQALSSSKSCSAEVQKKRSRDVYGDESSSGSDDVLKISDLEIESRSNRADEIFQRSRSKRVARRQTLLSVTHEEDVSETDENVTIGSYSLRRTAERRRSLQPRRYLGGRTPPSRRTLMGVPAQAQMCNFSVDVEQEPEVMDDMEWGRIAKLKDVSKETFSDAEEKTRLEELHRRNTLCLPHLKSSYPIELSVKGANDQDEQMKTLGKRKNDIEEDAPRATYKKWKTEQQLLSSTDLSNFTRAVKSESNVCTNARMTNKSEKTSNTFADKLLEKPHPQSMSFEISVEPAKTIKPPPRLTRSVASTSIKNTQIAPQKLQESIYPVVLLTQNKAMENKSSDSSLKNKSKDLPSQISRGENKRNSFSRATHKVAATFRGKMMAKNK